MEIQIVAKRENPLLKRVEVRFRAVHKSEATPTRDALRSHLAKELQAKDAIVVLDHHRSTSGRYETVGYAKLYRSKEQALAVERHHVLVRNQLVAPEVKAAEPAKAEAAPKAPRPAPSKKEAPKPTPKAEAPPAKEEKKASEKKEEKAPEKKPEAKKAEPGKKKEGK